jgi:hypothetical protein
VPQLTPTTELSIGIIVPERRLFASRNCGASGEGISFPIRAIKKRRRSHLAKKVILYSQPG